jgi:hypothetical protein
MLTEESYELMLSRPWRVGRKVGRTIYAQVGDGPSDADPMIGCMDTRTLAQEVVDAHNARLEQPWER